MVDFHSHIIYGIDDGSKDFGMSIKMGIQAIDNSVHHIIATPHYNDYVKEDFFDLRDQHCNELNSYFESKNMDLKIEAAAEVAFISDWDRILDDDRLRIAKKYLLIEFPDSHLPDFTLDIIYKIRKKNLVPIIAHPERCQHLKKDKALLLDLVRLGCHFQADAGSFIGQFGTSVQKTAKYFQSCNLYQFFGSDAHEPDYRNYNVLNQEILFESLNSYLVEGKEIPELYFAEPDTSLLKRIISYLK